MTITFIMTVYLVLMQLCNNYLYIDNFIIISYISTTQRWPWITPVWDLPKREITIATTNVWLNIRRYKYTKHNFGVLFITTSTITHTQNCCAFSVTECNLYNNQKHCLDRCRRSWYIQWSLKTFPSYPNPHGLRDDVMSELPHHPQWPPNSWSCQA